MYIVIFITVSSPKEAEHIAKLLLNKHLVACVNIVKDVQSMFWWRGKIDNAREILLIAKSKKSKFPAIVRTIKSVHSYEVPEIIAMPIIAGERKYLEWIDGSISKSV
jgi:periplasmic divalent cation tolerance protein